MHTIGTVGLWAGFFIFIFILLIIDMVILGRRKSQVISARQAFQWTLIWFVCAMLFNLVLWWVVSMQSGPVIAHQKALEFFTGYVIEESLSVDNMFAFLMIFNYFHVPHEYQRRVLLYGVLGAIVLRLIMILLGTWVVSQFHWVLYLFGLFLVVTGIKMIWIANDKTALEHNALLNWLRRHIRVTEQYHAEHFFIKRDLLWYATPLFLVLVLIEFSDVIFALDSIPAIFAITNDPFIIFTSNIFAIMGLRALYFLLAHMAARFYLMKYGIALILVFIGAKMLVEPWIKVPILIALSIVLSILATTVILSMLNRRYRKP